jgi:hypothetical protein
MRSVKRKRAVKRGRAGARPSAHGAVKRAAGNTVRLPRRSKGRRPEFYDDPAIDQLFAIVTALAAEMSVAFDRLDTLERVLVRRGALSAAALESYEPDPRAAQQRAQRRDELLQRVFAVFDAYPQKKPITR